MVINDREEVQKCPIVGHHVKQKLGGCGGQVIPKAEMHHARRPLAVPEHKCTVVIVKRNDDAVFGYGEFQHFDIGNARFDETDVYDISTGLTKEVEGRNRKIFIR